MTTEGYRLVIGDKNWSSWSLRPWLAMKRAGIAFQEINVRLRRPESKEQILRHSPSGFVPALIDGDLTIWDSLAIIEYLAERHHDAGLWPADRVARAIGRSAAAEIHSGFNALRQSCSMQLLERAPLPALPPEAASDVARILSLWRELRGRFGAGGPFLLGGFTAVDAMYAPVASRFRTYLPELGPYGDDGTGQAYVEAIFAMPEMAVWAEAARAETAEHPA